MWRWLLGLALVLYGGYQVATQVTNSLRLHRTNADYEAAYAWLAQYPPMRPVLITNRFLFLWLRFEAHVNAPTLPWLADRYPRSGVAYAYVLTRGDSLAPAGAGPVVRQFGQVTIYHYVAPAVLGPRRPAAPPLNFSLAH